MDNSICFDDLFEWIPDYRKIVSIMFLKKNDNDLLTKCGFLKNMLIVYVEKLKIF